MKKALSVSYIFLAVILITCSLLHATCPVGSIAVDSDGVCIHSLKLDFGSMIDVFAENVSIETLSVQDVSIQGAIDIPSFTTLGVVHNDTSGNLSSSLIVNADVSASAGIIDTKLATISTAGKVANSATTATNANTANAIVTRDSSGNFSTNMISLVGTTTNATDVATKAYVDSIASGTSLNTANTIVKRDGTGSFAAQVVSMTDGVHSGNLVLSTDPSTSTTGNIMKGSSRFMHNTGTSNTFVGVNAGNFTTSGTGQNSAFGVNALIANTTGNNNVAYGYNSLSSCTTGSNNIAIGSGSGVTLTTGSNNIYLAANASTASEGGTIRIGTPSLHTSCFIQSIGVVTLSLSATAVLIDTSTGKLGILVSSEKFKRNIKDMDNVSANILKLRPVTFTYKDDEFNTEQFGLIAEEVNKIFPAIITKDENGEPKTVQYHVLPVLLLNEMKKQQQKINQQDEMIQDLMWTIGNMQSAIVSLQEKLQSFSDGLEFIEY